MWKKRKILKGLIRTNRSRVDEPYNPGRWFDRFYECGVSDRQTIASDRDATLAKYHYASVELLITRHLVNHGIHVQDTSVFDIGSGAGYWLNFYKNLGAKRCTEIDVSERPTKYLRAKYNDDDSVEIKKGLFQDFLGKT